VGLQLHQLKETRAFPDRDRRMMAEHVGGKEVNLAEPWSSSCSIPAAGAHHARLSRRAPLASSVAACPLLLSKSISFFHSIGQLLAV
jgi:hypothetical protein